MAKILVVEDDIFIQNLVAFRLKDRQHQVLVAADGQQGVQLAQDECPDLIIMDLRLPVLDGWQATESLKSNPQTVNIPILALTAQSFAAVQDKFGAAGCDGYVMKPIDFSVLFSQIDLLTKPHIVA